jgi:hypothetical protein
MIIFQAFKQFSLTSFMCLLLVSFSTPNLAAQLYRYKNEQGNLVMGQAIPPELVSKGYDILNAKGRVIETIPPALSAKQIAQRDAQIAQEEQEKIAKAAQDEIDDKLTQLYSHPDDAVRILERRTQDIKSVIQLKLGRINSANKQIREQEELAANKQRKGLKIPNSILTKITAFEKDVVNAEADIVELQHDYKVVLKEFDIKIRRLELINDQKSEKYTALLNSFNEDKHLK